MIHFDYWNYPKKNYFDPNVQERISNKLANLFTATSRLDKFIYSIIREVMDRRVVPYFTDVITRHSEPEFHEKIAEGFDLVEDMRINHPDIFNGFVNVAKKFRKRLVFNENVLLEMIIDIVESYPYYWNITIDERAKLYDMVLKLKMEIYS